MSHWTSLAKLPGQWTCMMMSQCDTGSGNRLLAISHTAAPIPGIASLQSFLNAGKFSYWFFLGR